MSQPGLLYVAATLLPLLSFLLLFAGGRRWGKAGAYVATAAIGGACVLSVIGFVLFLAGHSHEHADHDKKHEHGHEKAQKDTKKDEKKGDHGKKEDKHEHDAKDEKHEDDADHDEDHEDGPPWTGSLDWAFLHFTSTATLASSLKLGYYIDGLSATMFVMVSFIATLIHLFSIGYMGEEMQERVEDHHAHVARKGRFPRFFMFLSLFCFSMLNLILADNLFQIFVSWELVGICSYLLISFYYERRSASNAANKAFITNRVGDAGFIIGLLILWTYAGTFNFYSTHDAKGDIKEAGIFDTLRSPAADAHGDEMPQNNQIVRANPIKDGEDDELETSETGSEVVLFGKGHFHAPHKEGTAYHYDADAHRTIPYWALTLAGIGIFLGCVGKSAQFPLSVWLPDAMEGPTPVSALIHAATMVAAGVYLVGRAFPIFTPEVLLIIAYTGGITLFVAATIAIVQTDIKKVLAYSTVSQLGFMMLALGVGGWVAGLFHLITHAFFKALLFLCSGSVIYGVHHEQEMTQMGGLYPKMKITALTMLVGVLAIAGTPLFSGWYSKDAILVQALSFASIYPKHFLLFVLPLLTAGITAFYMFRLWFMTFTGHPRDQHVYAHAKESPWVMTVPLILLAVMSVVVAWGLPPWDVRQSALEHLLHHNEPASVDADAYLAAVGAQVDGNFISGTNLAGPHDLAGALALLSAGIGVILAFSVYYYGWLDPAETKAQFAGVHRFLMRKWYFDEFYSAALVRPALIVAGWCKWFDAVVIDGIIHHSAKGTVKVSNFDGRFDLGIIDGLVNLTAKVVFAIGAWLRVFQTGQIRNYILFLAVAAVGIFAILSYVWAM